MRRRLQFSLGAIFFALLLVYGGARFVRGFATLGMESDPGWVARQVGSQVRVDRTRSAESEAVLRRDDEVLAINGQPIKQASDVIEIFHHLDPGTPYTVVIGRGGFAFEARLSSHTIL
jgi:S1-C subfamily serine protease